MHSIMKSLYNELLKILPTKIALYIMYFHRYHKILNLRNPKYFGEKIQWIKLNGKVEELGPYVDKYEVKKYVKKMIGDKYLAKTYGIYDSPEEINYDELPSQFVMKCTNGTQQIIICRDKSKLNYQDANMQMKKWIRSDFYRVKREYQYRNVKNRILIEEYLEDDSGELRDYKFYCFDGEPYWYSIFQGRYSNKTVDTYSINGEFLSDFKNGNKKVITSDGDHQKLRNLDEFILLAKKLSSPFTFVRVDFYMVNGKVYFGELTFTDGAGCEPMFPIEKYDIQFGEKIALAPVMKYNPMEK